MTMHTEKSAVFMDSCKNDSIREHLMRESSGQDGDEGCSTTVQRQFTLKVQYRGGVGWGWGRTRTMHRRLHRRVEEVVTPTGVRTPQPAEKHRSLVVCHEP